MEALYLWHQRPSLHAFMSHLIHSMVGKCNPVPMALHTCSMCTHCSESATALCAHADGAGSAQSSTAEVGGHGVKKRKRETDQGSISKWDGEKRKRHEESQGPGLKGTEENQSAKQQLPAGTARYKDCRKAPGCTAMLAGGGSRSICTLTGERTTLSLVCSCTPSAYMYMQHAEAPRTLALHKPWSHFC